MTDAPPRPRLVDLLFSTTTPVDRGTYAITGVTLMALKYGIDAAIIYATTGHLWTPLEYLSPAISTRTAILGGDNEWALVALVVLALPFLWIGLTMTMRRAIDAGIDGIYALVFLIPGLNYLLMLTLAVLPSSPDVDRGPRSMEGNRGLRSALFGVLFGVLFGLAVALATTLVSTHVFQEYGQVLFLATPTMIGAGAGWFYNRRGRQGAAATVAVALLSILISGLALLVFAIEGAICVFMAMPIAAVGAVIGALIGRAIASESRGRLGPLLVVSGLLPAATAIESFAEVPLPEREVATAIVIDATPAEIWPNVVGFAELDAPPRWIYELGVAYPQRARIVGEGVGAVRHCEFTTGAFVEPITAWEPGRRLAFDVTAQPPPMHEWSPYQHVHPPHLDGYLRSRRGEFRLVDLGDGRTRLEGSTWYTLDLGPAAYWAIWSDAMIHGIHQRVLEHIKRLSEAGVVSVPAARGDLGT